MNIHTGTHAITHTHTYILFNETNNNTMRTVLDAVFAFSCLFVVRECQNCVLEDFFFK